MNDPKEAPWGSVDTRFDPIYLADPTIRDDEGMTPAMLARQSERVSDDQRRAIVEYLSSIEGWEDNPV